MGNNTSNSSLDQTSDDESKNIKLTRASHHQVMRCSFCLGIPKTEIYQCNIGHISCATCSKKTEGCLICKNNEVKGDLIRNHLAEKLSERLVIPCRFIDQGCNFTTAKVLMEDHETKCIYSGNILPLCRYLEYNCDHLSDCTNTEGVIDHFGTHGAILKTGSYLELHFAKFSELVSKCFEKLENGKFFHWKPVILQNLEGDSFILLSRLFWLNKVKMFAVICLQLGSEENGINYEVEICVQTCHEKVRPIKWKETCQRFSDIKCLQTWSALRTCFTDELEDLYTDLNRTMNIRVSLRRLDNAVENSPIGFVEAVGDETVDNVVLDEFL